MKEGCRKLWVDGAGPVGPSHPEFLRCRWRTKQVRQYSLLIGKAKATIFHCLELKVDKKVVPKNSGYEL